MGCLANRTRRSWRTQHRGSPCWTISRRSRTRARPGRSSIRCRRSCFWCWRRPWPAPTISSRCGCGAGSTWLFLRRFLPFQRGIPSHDTLGDVVNALDPALFKRCFVGLGRGPARGRARHRRDRRQDLAPLPCRAKGREPLHLVSAWASRQRLVLGQEAVAGKSNEITAIPRLLERLELTGALVTIDAIGCQTKIARAILAKEADYLLAVKANWPGAARRDRRATSRACRLSVRPVRDHRRRPRPDRGPPPCRQP